MYLYGTGEAESRLRQLIGERNMQEKIILKGHTNNVRQALRESHLLLQLTHMDAMPLAVIEALAMARPVVVSNVGDMPEWVKENKNGWISTNASVEAIDAALEKCWQDRNKWENMGRNSYQLLKEKFPAIPEEFFLKQVES